MTEPHYADDSVTLYAGDCLDVLRGLPDASVDAVVTDPPYGLGFMGHQWDQPGEFGALRGNGKPAATNREAAYDHTTSTLREGAMAAGRYDQSQPANARFGLWCQEWATECLRVLKPGGHLLAFGGSRTWHRLAAAVEDAGFELRDSIAWLYGSGFPKSLDVSKAIDKAAGVEFSARPAEGVGFMRADGRDGYNVTKNRLDREGETTPDAARWQGWGTALKPAFEPIVVARKPLVGTVAANVLAHRTGALNVDGCRIDGEPVVTFDRIEGDRSREDWRTGTGENRTTADRGRWPANVILDESQADALDAQSGTLTSGANPTRRGSDKFRDAYGDFAGQAECEPARGVDTGGASRFFYTAKADSGERPRVDGVAHPTVKPLALMRWLVRLVTPPGGVVLEPFAGSGATVEACILEGFRCIAIEREADYLPLILDRVKHPARSAMSVAARSSARNQRAQPADPDEGLLGILEGLA